ncbi:metal-sensitive transcriptional regulator [Patescibacteria group bacterium]|nr:metal-sensitive transcriptional regulator [Patescibacteria group bacterium]
MNQEKQKALLSLKKASGQIKKVVKMMEEDCYCIDVMQQNLAAIGLLKSAHESLLENHLETCFIEAIENKNKKKKQEMIAELSKVMKFYNK